MSAIHGFRCGPRRRHSASTAASRSCWPASKSSRLSSSAMAATGARALGATERRPSRESFKASSLRSRRADSKAGGVGRSQAVSICSNRSSTSGAVSVPVRLRKSGAAAYRVFQRCRQRGQGRPRRSGGRNSSASPSAIPCSRAMHSASLASSASQVACHARCSPSSSTAADSRGRRGIEPRAHRHWHAAPARSAARRRRPRPAYGVESPGCPRGEAASARSEPCARRRGPRTRLRVRCRPPRARRRRRRSQP